MHIRTLKLGPMQNFVYVLQDPQTQQAAVIDPAWDADAILAAADCYRITDILITHWHDDHINAIDDLLGRLDSQAHARVHLLRSEAEFWRVDTDDDADRLVLHQDSDSIPVGVHEVRILHTPGHSPGSACFYVDGALFTGDTLFIYGCGHCELPGADPRALYYSLQRLLRLYPPDTLIYPGHDYATPPVSTLGEQKRLNPFLHQLTLDDFVRFRGEHNNHRHPPYRPVLRGDPAW